MSNAEFFQKNNGSSNYGNQTVNLSRVSMHFSVATEICITSHVPGVAMLSNQTNNCTLKMHSLWCWLWEKMVFGGWKLALSNSVNVFPVSVIVSIEINRSHYFQSIPHIKGQLLYIWKNWIDYFILLIKNIIDKNRETVDNWYELILPRNVSSE